MQSRKSIFLFLGLLLLTAGLLAQPRWVKKYPVDAKFYIGVGNASKIKNSNYVDVARNIALNQIASGIAVSIQSTVSQEVVEKSGMATESFQSNITAIAKADLSDYELVESYESASDYWVYYRLSKETFQSNFEKRKSVAIAEATKYFTDAQNSEKQGNLKETLISLLKAGNSLSGFRGMGLTLENSSQPQFLDVEVFSKLGKFLSALEITLEPESVSAKMFDPESKFVNIGLSYRIDGISKPLGGIALQAFLQKGKADIVQVQPTSEAGKSTVRFSNLKSTGEAVIAVTLDCKTLIGAECQQLSLPERRISVKVPAPNIFIQSPEPTAGNKIREMFASQGWQVVDDKAKADFFADIKANTTNGAEMSGVFTTFADGSVAVLRTKGNEEIFRINLTKIVGGGRDFDMARKTALNKMADEFVLKIKETLF